MQSSIIIDIYINRFYYTIVILFNEKKSILQTKQDK